MNVICVDPKRVSEVWPHVADLVKRGISYGCEDLDKTRGRIHSGEWLLWLVIEDLKIKGIVVTALIGNACEIIAAAGHDFITSLHLLEHIESYARAEGRKRMLLTGRKGWQRALKNYHPIGTVGHLVSLERIL